MTFNNPISLRRPARAVHAAAGERPIPAGQYVVKIIVPPGYKLQKEEDKNVDFGDTYVPQQFWLTGYPLADAAAARARPSRRRRSRTTRSSRRSAWASCTRCPRAVALPRPAAGAFAGEMRPLCDAKLVTLRDGQQAAPDFHLFTEAPIAGHIYGMVLDDTTNEFDPNAPTFGEKYAPPFIGVAIRDWQGREITRTYTDQYGMYNALVPTHLHDQPAGAERRVAEHPGRPASTRRRCPDPAGPTVPDPHFQKQYSHFCYPLQYLPGKTTYLDTPVRADGRLHGQRARSRWTPSSRTRRR